MFIQFINNATVQQFAKSFGIPSHMKSVRYAVIKVLLFRGLLNPLPAEECINSFVKLAYALKTDQIDIESSGYTACQLAWIRDHEFPINHVILHMGYVHRLSNKKSIRL